jgi:hypothetical protein
MRTRSISGTVKFMMSNASSEPPKKPIKVCIRIVRTARPTPKMICPTPLKGVVAGSVAMKNAMNIELPMKTSKSNLVVKSMSPSIKENITERIAMLMR